MTKKKFFKKGTAYLLSAAMVLTGVGSISELGGVTVASAAGLDMPNPVLSLNFEETASGNEYTENGVNYTLTDSEIIADPDDDTNKVFYNKNGTTTGFMQSAQGTFADKSFLDGVSVHMKVRPNTQANDWNFLFGLGYKVDNANEYAVDGTIGFITRKWGTTCEAVFPEGNWQQGNKLGGSDTENPFDYFKKEENCNKWYDLTYVYGTDGELSIYVDGILTIRKILSAKKYDNIGGNSETGFIIGNS